MGDDTSDAKSRNQLREALMPSVAWFTIMGMEFKRLPFRDKQPCSLPFELQATLDVNGSVSIGFNRAVK